MKRLILFLFAACMTAAVYAQQAMPVILISAKGKVCYQSPNQKKKQKVVTGAVMKREGKVVLPKNTVATFYCDGKFVEKSGKQTINLPELFPTDNSMVKANFDLSFGDYTLAAFIMAANTKDKRDGWGAIDNPKSTADGWGAIDNPKSTADGWGAIDNPKSTADGWGTIDNPKSTADGWGGKGLQVSAIQPFGKVFPAAMSFYWSKPAGNADFHVQIRDKDDQMVMETTTKDTFWMVDLRNPAFKTGGKYSWTVETKESSPKRSNTLKFEIGAQAGRDKALQEVQKGELFAKSPEEIKLVMQAVALETNGWFEEASRIYEQDQKMHPDNAYVKLMHAAFWMRCGLKPKARAVYK